MRKIGWIWVLGFHFLGFGQDVMTPETLIELNRVSPVGITDDRLNVVYKITQVDVQSNSKTTKTFVLPIQGGTPREINDYSDLIVNDPLVSPDSRYKLLSE